MQIIPSVLESDFAEFERQLKRMEPYFPYIQIDVMDGQFVKTRSFPEVDRVQRIDTSLKYELHLMVANPLEEMRKWQSNDKVFRVLFHAEAHDPRGAFNFAKREGWEIGMVLNPETPLSAIDEFLPKLDAVQFMTIHPGRQGNPFIPEVLEKIKAFTTLTKRPLCLVDGAVNKDTIKSVRDAGADIACPGSAFTKADDVGKALKELQTLIS